MKKDIRFPKVEDTAVAVVRERNEKDEEVWNAYLLNFKDDTITGVLVSTKGYGVRNNEQVKTSVLRHFLDEVGPNSYAKIEMITEELMGLSNEFWVSFYHNKQIYDKKYVFVAESITDDHLREIPLIGKQGVMIE